MADYPGSIKSFTTKTDGVDDVLAAHVNDLQNEVEAIETELGTDPAGAFATVKDRLDDQETRLDALDGSSSTGVINNGATITLFAAPAGSVWNVIAIQSDDPTNRTSAAIVSRLTASAAKQYLSGTSWAISIDGAGNVQLTNSSGANRAYTAFYRRIY